MAVDYLRLGFGCFEAIVGEYGAGGVRGAGGVGGSVLRVGLFANMLVGRDAFCWGSVLLTCCMA